MKKHLVVALAYDQLCTFEFGCTVELFALDRPELGVPWYEFAVCAAESGPIRAAGGISVIAPFTLDLLGRLCPGCGRGARHQARDHSLALCRASGTTSPIHRSTGRFMVCRCGTNHYFCRICRRSRHAVASGTPRLRGQGWQSGGATVGRRASSRGRPTGKPGGLAARTSRDAEHAHLNGVTCLDEFTHLAAPVSRRNRPGADQLAGPGTGGDCQGLAGVAQHAFCSGCRTRGFQLRRIVAPAFSPTRLHQPGCLSQRFCSNVMTSR